MCVYLHISTKYIALREDVYKKLIEIKAPDESFSDAIEDLLERKWGLLPLCGSYLNPKLYKLLRVKAGMALPWESHSNTPFEKSREVGCYLIIFLVFLHPERKQCPVFDVESKLMGNQALSNVPKNGVMSNQNHCFQVFHLGNFLD